MKTLFKLLLLTSLLSSCCSSKLAIKPQKERTLEQMVTAVQDQYNKAVKILKDRNIKISITKADLTVKLSSVNTENADVTILIVKPSTKFIQTKTTSVTYELTDKTSTAGGAASLAQNNKLCDLIVDAATKFNNTHPQIGNLTKDNFSLDIVFSVENDNAAGLTFTIWGVGADAGYEHDSSVEHELVLTFVPKIN